ncbi:hypothetical protein PLESTB_001119100 [Pleodorina starrii]|uniref:Uncharacterized protein n=1 Tax=Pleodorina starrii TaxID=330485 RepID=A0A9W6F4W9_9CHLO|nr:hypothetical protein PLESTM_001356400 [Pleodorina starrii]GLC56547.1 hypothetical protein PLESTB_001119100 [Pleodorina starrii]GLC68790.1 hypothetical protein PLESTF_000737000 [Pleodorina starrii]
MRDRKVRTWISAMRARGQAFYNGNIYLLAGVLFEKKKLKNVVAPTVTPPGSNGNGHNGAVRTIYHAADTDDVQHDDEEDIGPQLLCLLKALY